MNITFIIFIFGLIIIFLFCVLVYIIGKEEKVREEKVFGFSFFPQYHGSRAYGSIIDQKLGDEGRISKILKPGDISISEILKREKPKNQRINVEKNKVLSLQKGFSKGRFIELYLPPTADDFPEEIKNSPIGKMLMFYTELTNASNTQIEAMSEGITRQKEHLKEMGWGEASISRLNYMQELFDDALNSIKETKKDKGTSSFSPPNLGG